jgi:hypothetical protein
VIVLLLGALRLTLKLALTVPVFPSVTVTLPTETVGGGSSSVIVPTPVPSAMVTLTASDRLTVKVSSISSSVSPLTRTVAVFVVWPGENTRLPPVDW